MTTKLRTSREVLPLREIVDVHAHRLAMLGCHGPGALAKGTEHSLRAVALLVQVSKPLSAQGTAWRLVAAAELHALRESLGEVIADVVKVPGC